MDGPEPGAIRMFGKLGPRIYKLLGGQGVQAKAVLLGVMGSLAQVGAPFQNFVVRAFCSMILLKEYQLLQGLANYWSCHILGRNFILD
jgi:hypothetical protein